MVDGEARVAPSPLGVKADGDAEQDRVRVELGVAVLDAVALVGEVGQSPVAQLGVQLEAGLLAVELDPVAPLPAELRAHGHGHALEARHQGGFALRRRRVLVVPLAHGQAELGVVHPGDASPEARRPVRRVLQMQARLRPPRREELLVDAVADGRDVLHRPAEHAEEQLVAGQADAEADGLVDGLVGGEVHHLRQARHAPGDVHGAAEVVGAAHLRQHARDHQALGAVGVVVGQARADPVELALRSAERAGEVDHAADARVGAVVEEPRLHVHVGDLGAHAVIDPGARLALPGLRQVDVRARRDEVRAPVDAELADLEAQLGARVRHRHRAHGLVAHARVEDELVAGLRLRGVERGGAVEDAVEHGAGAGEVLGRHRPAVGALDVDADRNGEAVDAEVSLVGVDEAGAVRRQEALRVDEGLPILRPEPRDELEASQPRAFPLVQVVLQLSLALRRQRHVLVERDAPALQEVGGHGHRGGGAERQRREESGEHS